MAHKQSIERMRTVVLVLTLLGSAESWAVTDRCKLDKNISDVQASAGLCKFDAQAKSFEGTPAQQASCLTREVKRAGQIGNETITPFFRGIFGTHVPSVKAVQALLDGQAINAADIGGPITRSISANYFIIHDTSTPNCSASGKVSGCEKQGELPADRDNASWPFNVDFGGHPKPYPDRVAHAMTNRIGASVTEVDFADPIATTKFETCVDKAEKVNLFVGVENIQPRIGDPKIPKPGKEANDLVAPSPGFTARQYERLALLYVVASARRGQWLVPAFHGVIDNFYLNGHDDPQHFDMAAFSDAVQKHVEAVTLVP